MKTHYEHIASDDYTKCFCIESHYFTTQLLTPHYHIHHVDEMQYQRKKNNQLLFSSIIYTLRKLVMRFERHRSGITDRESHGPARHSS